MPFSSDCARDERRGPDVAADEVHDQLAGLARGLVLGRILGRDAVEPRGREAHELHDRRHRVGGVLAAAGAGSRARDLLHLVQLVERDLARAVGADGLEDRDDGRVADALVRARIDRAVVEDHARPIEATQGHRRARDRLVAADQADDAVEQVAAHDELDRVGDDLAADQRGLHALGAHRHAVADRHGVELHGRAAGRTDAVLDVFRQPALVVVARHGLDPGRADADQRLGQVLVREADRLEHRARRRTIRSVGQGRGVPLGRVARSVVRVLGAGVGHLVGVSGSGSGGRGARAGDALAAGDDRVSVGRAARCPPPVVPRPGMWRRPDSRRVRSQPPGSRPGRG